ncbi:MAG TPA: DUF4342 domain-containing protein [Firmicutes bacterium]|nr:DUF4342 domain-containing protein [Bacillota bacterium]
MEKLESIEKLRERAEVSYDEAREAYEYADGDLLEALIYLEKQGKVQAPQGGGYYKSEHAAQPEHETGNGREQERKEYTAFKETLDKIWQFFYGLFQKGNSIDFEILKEKKHMISFPVTILVLLLIFAPWLTIAFVIAGLFFGFHYQFVSRSDKQ